MKKKSIAVLAAMMVAASMTCTAFAAVEPAAVADLPVEAEFEPNADYTYYTVVEYSIEDIGADLVCTVCANDELTDFEILCNFYGDDQDWVGTYDGKESTMESDKTGFMDGDAANIIQAAIDQDIWVLTGADVASTEEGTEAGTATLTVEAEFEPNTDYPLYTVVEYSIEDIGADLVCTVCANEDKTDFEILCNFYGDDQDWVGTYDGKETTMESDKTGFMDGDAANIIQAAIDQDIWLATK